MNRPQEGRREAIICLKRSGKRALRSVPGVRGLKRAMRARPGRGYQRPCHAVTSGNPAPKPGGAPGHVT
jgi:hypothetical protein